jgi:hypothetical protein
MTKEKIQRSLYPVKQPSYNAWCKKFKVGSRINKFEHKKFYAEGEYDYDKFIKMIKNYGEDRKQSNIWKQISEAFFALCKGQVQKAWNKTSVA